MMRPIKEIVLSLIVFLTTITSAFAARNSHTAYCWFAASFFLITLCTIPVITYQVSYSQINKETLNSFHKLHLILSRSVKNGSENILGFHSHIYKTLQSFEERTKRYSEMFLYYYSSSKKRNFNVISI